MSRVYFHSPSGDAELLGAERAYAGCMVSDLASGLWRSAFVRAEDSMIQLTRGTDLYDDRDPMRRAQFADRFKLAFRVGQEGLLTWRGKDISGFSLALNTAIQIGDDPVKFLARMHGQCELHSYVEGPNRAWLADIIERGLKTGVFRDGMGWDTPPNHPHGKGAGVIPLLRSRDDEPVVMSYSVCDGFPNWEITDWQPPADADLTPTWAKEEPQEWASLTEDEQDDYHRSAVDELWGDLPEEERWATAMDGLRRRSEIDMLELKPDNWDDYRFGHELTVLDLQAKNWRERVERALGFELSAVPGQENL